MLKRNLATVFLACLSSSCIAADLFRPEEINAGEHYIELKESVSDAPVVIEFFSFYCQPCYGFTYQHKVNEHVTAVLPPKYRAERYHVSSTGSMGKALTEAWSVARALGVEAKVEGLLYDAVQCKKITPSEKEIQKVFMDAGVSEIDYKNAKDSFQVKALTRKQDEMAEKFGVNGTPSYYVAGKYLIINSGIKAKHYQTYGHAYADVVYRLIKKNQTL